MPRDVGGDAHKGLCYGDVGDFGERYGARMIHSLLDLFQCCRQQSLELLHHPSRASTLADQVEIQLPRLYHQDPLCIQQVLIRFRLSVGHKLGDDDVLRRGGIGAGGKPYLYSCSTMGRYNQ